MPALENSDQATPVPDEPGAFGVAALLIAAIAGGAALGLGAPATAQAVSQTVDITLLAMICLLFFDIRLGAFLRAIGNLRFLIISWCCNFLIVPVIGYAIASLVLSGEPLLFAGLMIYFLAPCTDWFLGFTRMARGDTELGAVLIPINLLTQLALFPVWLWLFTPATGLVDLQAVFGLLFQWFLLPLIAMQSLRFGLERLLSVRAFEHISDRTSQLLPLVLAVLIVQIFAMHVTAITANADTLVLIAIAVFLFFCANYVISHSIARLAHLTYPQHALLSMTLAARNAPLMLALTAVAIPEQPLLLAAIVIGLLVEIPLLTVLRQLLLRRFASSP